MNPLQLHVAGATVRHESPFAALEVPVSYELLPIEIREAWVRPLYFGLRRPHVEAFLASHLREVSDELVLQLLTHFDWRSRATGAYLAALGERTSFTEHIGRLLLRSDVCYAGAAYCEALASFNLPQGISLLERYLSYYLSRTELWFDQRHAMGALAYLDKKNNTATLSQYLPQWYDFVANKSGWDLEHAVAFFEECMEVLQALKRHNAG